MQIFKTENCKCSKLRIFVLTPFYARSSGESQSVDIVTCKFFIVFPLSENKHLDSMMGFMCYYGHVQNTSNLGEGNVYKSYFLGALVEIPCWSVPFIIAKMGRRWPLLFLFTCSGICGVVYGFIPDDLPRLEKNL